MFVHFLARTELFFVRNNMQYTPYTVKPTSNRIPRKLNVFQTGLHVFIIQMAGQKFRTRVLIEQYRVSSRFRFQTSTWRSILTDFSVSTVQNKVLNSKHSMTWGYYEDEHGNYHILGCTAIGHSENGGSMFLQNMGIFLSVYMTLHPRRQ
jgi:hypothetical protein